MVFLGYLPLQELLECGITVGLGTDATAASGSLNLFKEMRLTALIHKGHHGDPTIVPAEKVLEMATIDGAKALGWEDEIGSLEVGKKADLIILNTKQPHFVPLFDVVSNLVYSAQGNDVRTVIVDGKVLLENDNVRTVDEGGVMSTSHKLANTVVRRHGIEPTPRFPTW